MSSQLYPEVRDATTLGARFSQPIFLPIGVEGEAGATGTATVAVPETIGKPSDADAKFGAGSSLANLVKFLLDRGIPEVIAVASEKGSLPLLTERQAAWALLESDPNIRLRLTDSAVQAELVALAESAENAELINHKQVAIGGMASGTTLAALQSAATAIASKRFVLVAPGVYDENGILLSGMFAAAAVAGEIAKNGDVTDDLDTLALTSFTGIEKDANGMPLFRNKVAGGAAVNEFETLLTSGVSPLRNGRNGGVEITHVRTTYTTDSTMDALMTRLIADQLFVDVRDYIEGNNFLRRGNTERVREDVKAGVEALLQERSNWLRPKTQPDGTDGYFVQVVPSANEKQITVSYKGVIVRGIQTVLVDAQLEIPL